MNFQEYELMSRMEDKHWWYRGLRESISKILNQKRFQISQGAIVLDAGCGTGGNLQLLQQLLKPAYLGGFDYSPLAVSLTQQKIPEADIYQSDICNPAIHVEQLDLILSCDVIYIPGVKAALPGLQRLVSRLSTGGLLIINLPAYNWLYSEHDVAIHTSERYTATKVCQLIEQLNLKVELVTYRLCLLFPAIVLARLPSVLRRKPAVENAKSDLSMPSRPINAVLSGVMKVENLALNIGVRYPWGSSILAVARKQ